MFGRTRSQITYATRPPQSIYVNPKRPKSLVKKVLKMQPAELTELTGLTELAKTTPNQREIEKYKQEYLACGKEFDAIPGVWINHGIAGISSRCLDRPDFHAHVKDLTDALKQADAEYITLTGSPPCNSKQYLDAVFDEHSVPRSIYVEAVKVEKARRTLATFVENYMSVDLPELRAKVIDLQERMRRAKYDLRRLQHMGEVIGAGIFVEFDR